MNYGPVRILLSCVCAEDTGLVDVQCISPPHSLSLTKLTLVRQLEGRISSFSVENIVV